MSPWPGGITLLILFTLSVTPASESKLIKIKRAELAELVTIWKQACQCLDTMLKLTGEEARAKGEGLPEDVTKELGNLLKIISVFNVRMQGALKSFFTNSTESVEKAADIQKWRKYLGGAVEKISGQIELLRKNIGMKSISATSVENIENLMDKVRHKCMGLTLCLRNSKIGFEQRFFEMIGRMIRTDLPLDT